MIKNTTIVMLLTAVCVLAIPSTTVHAVPSGYSLSEQLDFGAALEEALGHFRALELNIDEQNAMLARTHATHPIAELYDSIKPVLVAADPALDAEVKSTLEGLADATSDSVSRSQAQSAIENAKDVVETARMAVIGPALSGDVSFNLMLMTTLLETSIVEYDESISDGKITAMAEFQDGSAFVWRSQQILDAIGDNLDARTYVELEAAFDDVNALYEQRADPSEVDKQTGYLLDIIDEAIMADIESKIEFGAALEEALGHFRALELNIDEQNAVLARTHATHPIAELYDSIKPVLVAADPALDAEVKSTLEGLADATSDSVSRSQAQSAIENAKDVVETARMAVIGPALSGDVSFNLMLMTTLLETSIVEYDESISDGKITAMAEFQDGSAFVWRSQQILNSIGDNLDARTYVELEAAFDDVNALYAQRADPSEVDKQTGYLLAEIDEILGVSGQETLLQTYVDNINALLTDAKAEYRAGNADLALSYVTNAYLNNFEFLERPLVDAGERELMEDVEVMMREELRGMIKAGASASEVSDQIDAILLKMDAVAVIVPEFGAMAAIVLAVAVSVAIVFASRSRLSIISPRTTV